MSPRPVRVLLSAIVLLSLAASAFGQKPTPAPATRISGVVTADGKPVAGAPVWAADVESGKKLAASSETDAEGRYSFKGLSPGRYVVCAFKAGYVAPAQSLQHYAKTLGRIVTLDEGQQVEAFDISLSRGGVITGRVSDARGRPMPEVWIRIETIDDDGDAGYAALFRADYRKTDDRGVYRIYGIPPGRYVVSAYESGDDADLFPKTYFPQARTPADAQAITIGGTEEVPDVDIVVPIGPRVERFEVSGRVAAADDSSALPAGISVWLQRLYARDSEVDDYDFPPSSEAASNGEFHLAGVRAGTYDVVARRSCGSGCQYIVGEARITVSANMQGVVVPLRDGSTVEGRVVLEGVDDPSVAARVRELDVNTDLRTATESGVRNADASAHVAADGMFHLYGVVAGTHRINVSEGAYGVGFHLLRVEAGGRTSRDTIDVEAGRDLEDVRLVLGYGTGVIRGRVRVVNGPLGPKDRVVVFVRDGEGSYGAMPDVDGNDEFLVRGLLPGRYTVSAIVAGATDEQSVTVAGGSSAEVTLTIDKGKSPPTHDEDDDDGDGGETP